MQCEIPLHIHGMRGGGIPINSADRISFGLLAPSDQEYLAGLAESYSINQPSEFSFTDWSGSMSEEEVNELTPFERFDRWFNFMEEAVDPWLAIDPIHPPTFPARWYLYKTPPTLIIADLGDIARPLSEDIGLMQDYLHQTINYFFTPLIFDWLPLSYIREQYPNFDLPRDHELEYWWGTGYFDWEPEEPLLPPRFPTRHGT
jgi:hypothetical protein